MALIHPTACIPIATQVVVQTVFNEEQLHKRYIRLMTAEKTQELGRAGVAIIKRWLEATTFIELPFDAYNHTLDCTLPHLDGTKIFDLQGHFLTGQKDPVIVESKRYTSPGGQYKEFMHFLAIAYSSTVKEKESLGGYRNRHFLWVTFHPFNLDNWTALETRDHMVKALGQHQEYLKGRTIEEDLVRDVASRVMVLVFNPKQENLSLSRDELKLVRVYLDRKAESL